MANSKPVVLIADDDKDWFKIYKELPVFQDYTVLWAPNKVKTLEIVKKEPLSLVLLDIKFPKDEEGMEVLKETIKIKPELPVIMISAYGTIKMAIEAVRLGAYDFFEKDADLQRQCITIKNALEKKRLEEEREILLREARARYRMVGSSQPMKEVYRLIERIAPMESTVLIRGESGTGKELVARAIHNLSKRAGRPFVCHNCASGPPGLLESDLFGHKKGAFTDAKNDKKGKFQEADTGTLFLDEIGDMELNAQAKVLRALEEGEVERVGDPKPKKVDVRLIAATNKDIRAEIEKGKFREDLFYRLNAFAIEIPPLRKRKEDIPQLTDYFVAQFCEANNIRLKQFSPKALNALLEYDWPGNVRELKNFVERLIILTDSDTITDQDVVHQFQEKEQSVSLYYDLTWTEARKKFERDLIEKRLVAHNWNVTKTAASFKMERTHLSRLIGKYGIKKGNQ
ncbi:MAG: sigma-54-dependent transcriptional regulator [bacterium]